MKKIKINFLMIVAVFVFTLSSCQKVLDINEDPNNLSSATPELVLPSAQTTLGMALGNQWNYIGSMWAQYWTGGYGVSSSQLEFYSMTTGDANLSWTTAYARSLKDLQYLNNSGEPRYMGVSKIMSAYLFQMLTDLFGDIPMDDALQGDEGIISPTYNTEQEVYERVLVMLDEGIRNLDSVSPSSSIVFKELDREDIIFSGDLDKWHKFANTLKLKVLVRSGQYSAAETLMNSGIDFIEAGDDAKVSYYETGKNTNPIYARFMARTGVGMYYVGAWSSVHTLAEMADPRKNKIYTIGTAGDSGVLSGDINSNTIAYPAGGSNTRFSRPNTSYVFSALTPVFILSSWESKFLQAEVITRQGGDGEAMLKEALRASFDYYGLSAASADAYEATLDYATSSLDDRLNIIGIQKWIAMNGLQMAEGWLETLRFDRPSNRIFSNGIFTSPILTSLGAGVFPSSFIYPSSEVNNNPNVPQGRVVTDKRFWDN